MRSDLLLDTNLAVLLAVGLANRDYVSKHKRLKAFDLDDFDALCDLVASSSGIVFSPNVLTETSNIARQIEDPIKSHVAASISKMAHFAEESYVRTTTAVVHASYTRLGLTDAVLLTMCRTNCVLLTVDLDLYLAASSAGFDTINYNHIREQRPTYK